MGNLQLTFSGFNKRFEELIKDSKTYSEAYDKAEDEHEHNFGSRRYSDYQSFRHLRRRRIKNKR